jgi:hypothetical protein
MRRVAWPAMATGALVVAACAVALPGAPDCPVMPANNYWHADVSSLPVHPSSDQWVASIGADDTVHADFGSGTWDGGPIGIPYTTVDAAQPDVPISFYYPDESDPGPYPIPADAPIEGGSSATGDRHVIVVESDSCTLYEVYDATPDGDGSWSAGSGAIFDLGSNDLRPDGWTSADAAGLPILPGLVRWEEADRDNVRHALRLTAPQTQTSYVWPATHQAGAGSDPTLPPMGAWFRLKASVDIAGFSPEVQPILEAMATHGLILADNGSPWYITGVPDERWDNDLLRELADLTGSDFEAVDTAGLIVSTDSGQVAG